MDIGAAITLTVLGVVGFRTAFGGIGYLVVGVIGAIIGALLGFVLAKARLPLLVSTATGVFGFFVAGALVLRPDAIAEIVPTPATLVELMRTGVTGWRNLLTAEPPVGTDASLLVIPFLCAYVGAVASVLLAGLVRRVPVCVVPPMAIMAVSVLFGVNHPAALLLQGGVFGAVAIGWMSFRESHKRRTLIDTGRSRRLATGAGILAVATVGAVLLGPRLPPTDDRPRFVLRDRTDPPFDPSQYPSPLIGLRRFLAEEHKETVLFTVMNMPDGVPIRLAVMDDYDGVVWRVTGRGSEIGGSFNRVGQNIPLDPTTAGGRTVSVSIEMKDLARVASVTPAVWLPVLGDVQSVDFSGTRSDELTRSFRFNRVADVAAVPARMATGDTYTVEARLADDLSLSRVSGQPPADFISATQPELPPKLADTVEEQSKDPSPSVAAQNLATFLRAGFYSDGGPGTTNISPGHSVARLNDFLTKATPTGNAEQYAAAMGLMARSLGIPSRVVMGFRPASSGPGPVDVTGKDVDAWVEVAFAGVGWLELRVTPDPSQKPAPEEEPKPTPTRDEAANQSPVPPTLPPADIQLEEQEKPLPKKVLPKPSSGRGAIPGVVLVGVAAVGLPLALVLGLASLVIAFKSRRRRRRRTVGGPDRQIAGAWSELVDAGRDQGAPVPDRATRLEVAQFLPMATGEDIARSVDAALFGKDDPTAVAAEELWRRVDEARQRSWDALPKPGRARAAVSLTSLRPQTPLAAAPRRRS